MASALVAFSFFSHSSAVRAATKEIFSAALQELELESLRSQNRRLQWLVEESQRYQTEVFAELEKMRQRLHEAEEAEECLCTELGESEAESVLHARHYNEEMTCLKEQLLKTQALLAETRAQLQRQ